MNFATCLQLIKADLANYGGQGFWSRLRVFWFNQSFRLVLNYRIGRYCRLNRGFFSNLCILILKKHQIRKRHCDISYSAIIGYNIKFPHPLGIVIGDKAIVGNNVMLWHDVTLGSSGKEGVEMEYPELDDNVKVFPGARIIGKVKLGCNTVIAANAVVNTDIPAYSVAAGMPAKVVKAFN